MLAPSSGALAVCIVGAPKALLTSPCVAHSIREHLVGGLERQGYEVSLFVLAKIWPQERHGSMVSNVRHILNASVWEWRERPSSELEAGCTLATRSERAPWHYGHAEQTVGQLDGFAACLSAVRRAERQMARSTITAHPAFDAIMKVRPDALWLAPPPAVDWKHSVVNEGYWFAHLGQDNRIALSRRNCTTELAAFLSAPDSGGCCRPNDWFFSLPRAIASSVLGISERYRADCRSTNRSEALAPPAPWGDIEALVLWTALNACARHNERLGSLARRYAVQGAALSYARLGRCKCMEFSVGTHMRQAVAGASGEQSGGAAHVF